MSDERKIFLYFLTDEQGRSYYYENNVVKKSTTPYPLEKSPGGWLEQGVGFGRSAKYYGLNRSFTLPLKFVDDGASIIRTLFYTKRGIEETVFLNINKWDPDTDVYDPYYKGEIDLTKIDDQAAEGVNVNVIEGGIIKLVKGYESTIYEFPCDGSIPENKSVRLDGIKFNDTFNYNVLNIGYQATKYTIPLVFLSNDGYNANSANGTQLAETISDVASYVATSANWFYKFFDTTSAKIEGKIVFKNIDQNTGIDVSIYTSNGTKYTIYTGIAYGGRSITIPIDLTITVAEEALFLIIQQSGPFSNEVFIYEETSIKVSFASRFQTTTAWAIGAKDLWKLLVNKIGSGAYQADSTVLDSIPNILLTSVAAIRQEEGAVLKTSIANFFDSLNVLVNGAMSNQTVNGKESLFFEEKGYVFNSDVVTMNIGEVSDLKIGVALEYFFNTLSIGYTPQSYDEQAGRQEFNTTAEFTTPITKLKKELKLVSPYRADPFGIEFIRLNSPGKSTTKNQSNNDVFFLNVNDNPINEFYEASRLSSLEVVNQDLPFETFEGRYFTPNPGNTQFTFSNNGTALNFSISSNIYGTTNLSVGAQLIATLYRNSDVLATATFNGTGSSENFTLNLSASGITLSDSDVLKIYIENSAGITPDIIEILNANLRMQNDTANLYTLRRESYSEITGLENPETLFNIEDLTPARLVKKHGNFLRSVLHNLTDDILTFQTLSKNKELTTLLNGVRVIEKANVRIGNLDAPLFYPYVVTCKTQVPLNFIEVFNGAANGHIQFSYNGKTFYGFPIEVTVKPALNDAQEWKMLLSPKSNLADLVDLDIDGLNYNTMALYNMSVAHLSPVQFVPLNPTGNNRYHFKHMDSTWFSEQVQFYIAQAQYYQKYQFDDTANIQVRTNGLGPVQMDLYNCRGEIVRTVALDQITNDAIIDPYALFEGVMPFNDLDAGIYVIVLTGGTGESTVKFISEKIYLREAWDMTLLFEYTNNRNKQSTIFNSGYSPSIRVEGWIDNFEPGAKFATYEDQPADIQLLNGIPFRKFKLNIGANDGVPPWIIDKINRILLLTDTNIDGLGFTRNGDAQFEKVDVPGWPMKYWTIEIREAKNRDSVTLGTDGELNSDLTVIYNINTKAFGDGSEDNVVQVTVID